MFDQLHHHHQQCAGIPIMEMDGRWKAQLQQAPNCPRCASTNTKFCYYNNYSLAQPRYFCKGCRRYWTKGGSLRNVPVGGGCRKSRRSRSKHLSSSSSHNPGPAAGHQLEPSSTSSPEIDLAAVFARYVSQDQQSQCLETTSSPVDQLATRDDVTDHGQYYLFDQVANVGSFDQGLDIFWSSTSTEDGSSLSTANWEPMTAQQELDYSSSPLAIYAAASSVLDDQFTASVSANSLLGEFNWSCLDDQLAGFMGISADQL